MNLQRANLHADLVEVANARPQLKLLCQVLLSAPFWEKNGNCRLTGARTR